MENLNRKNLQLKLMRGIKKDIYTHLPTDSMLWDLFEYKEFTMCEDWDGISFGQLKRLAADLNDLVEDLHEEQTVSDDHRFKLDLGKDDEDKPTINVVSIQPETVGQWKSRLSKLQRDYSNDPEAREMIQAQKEKLFDRENLPEMMNNINPNIINTDI